MVKVNTCILMSVHDHIYTQEYACMINLMCVLIHLVRYCTWETLVRKKWPIW